MISDVSAPDGRYAGQVPPEVHDRSRLDAVEATGLLDTGPEESFDRLTSLAATLLNAPFAFTTLVDSTRSFWKSCVGVAASQPEQRQNAVEESFCQYVVGSSRELLVGDAANDPRTRENPSVKSMGVAAWAGFPLHAPDGEVLGSFCVMDTQRREWTDRDAEVLRTLAAAAAGEIALRAALERATRHAQESQALAHQLQESLLPPELPVVDGVQIAARYHPAGEGTDLVGDFFDVFQSLAGRWSFLLGDVCGKGLEAAKVAALARHTVGAASMRIEAPGEILAVLNDTLRARRETIDRFVTGIFGVIHPHGGGASVKLANGGHPPPLVRRADGRLEVSAGHGSAMGIASTFAAPTLDIELEPGDALLLYTDGVEEARRDGRCFGVERLHRLICATEGDADTLAATIERAARDFCAGPSTDDVAVLVLGICATSSSSRSP